MSSYGFEEADSQEESVRISGRVKWFDAGKGYGFIVPDDPSQTGLRDVLLHVTSLRNCGRESAAEGAIIVCEVVKRPKGWQVRFWTLRPLASTNDAAPPLAILDYELKFLLEQLSVTARPRKSNLAA